MRKMYVCVNAKKIDTRYLQRVSINKNLRKLYILLYSLIKTVFECNNHKILINV